MNRRNLWQPYLEVIYCKWSCYNHVFCEVILSSLRTGNYLFHFLKCFYCRNNVYTDNIANYNCIRERYKIKVNFLPNPTCNWQGLLKLLCLFAFYIIWKVKVKVAQSCPTLCNPMDCSPPGSSVHGILQTRILEWVAIPFSRGYFQSRDQTQVSHITDGSFTIWTSREAFTSYKYI